MALFPILNVKDIQMKEVLAAMLQLQDKLNTRAIGADWRKGQEDFLLAVSQECAEGIDHVGWKWWAKQLPDIAAVRMEVIDILHFALSQEMKDSVPGLPYDQIADNLVVDYRERKDTIWLDEEKHEPGDMEPVRLFQFISALACIGRNAPGQVLLLAEKLGMTFESVSILYRQKATLNLFRQNNGYREGAYIKHWAPNTEDNVFLPSLSEGINWAHGTAQDLLYGRLNVRYLEVTSAQQKH